LKPEWWGAPLVQGERKPVTGNTSTTNNNNNKKKKKKNNNNNNNNEEWSIRTL
jgi:hypothetical protein